jgi:3-oxoacyl-[acyl-carrier protein] reductase
MDLGIAGKVAVVSGASKGIGRAIAQRLAREDVRVVLAARGEDALNEAVAGIANDGGTALGVAADMTTADGVARVVDAARDAFGPVDIAVSNVYPPHTYGFDVTSDDDFLDAYQAIVMSIVHLARAVLPAMKQRGWGRLVNVGSFCMKEPHRELPLVLSNTVRPAALGLNKTLSHEVGPYGITVNTLGTGGFLTGRAKEQHDRQLGRVLSWEEWEAHINEDVKDRYSIPRIGKPEEMAATCAFLCSEHAAFITGQLITVDGGYTRGLF